MKKIIISLLLSSCSLIYSAEENVGIFNAYRNLEKQQAAEEKIIGEKIISITRFYRKKNYTQAINTIFTLEEPFYTNKVCLGVLNLFLRICADDLVNPNLFNALLRGAESLKEPESCQTAQRLITNDSRTSKKFIRILRMRKI